MTPGVATTRPAGTMEHRAGNNRLDGTSCPAGSCRADAELYDDEIDGEDVEGGTEDEGIEGETEDGVEGETEDEGIEGETEDGVEGETEDEGIEGETEDGEAGPEEIINATPNLPVIGVPAEGVDWITSPCGADDSWNEYVCRLRLCSASVVLA